MFKAALTYIGYFMAIFGFAAVVWKTAVYFDNKADKTTSLETKIETVIEKQNDQDTKIDSITVNLIKINDKLDQVNDNQTHLQNSYVLRLKNDKTLTRDEFIQYMEGLESKKNF